MGHPPLLPLRYYHHQKPHYINYLLCPYRKI